MSKNDPVTEEKLNKALEPYATKIELDEVISPLITREEFLQTLRQELQSIKDHMDARLQKNIELFMRYTETMENRILDRTDQLVEGRYQILRNANGDQLDIHHKNLKDHGKRIKTLEDQDFRVNYR